MIFDETVVVDRPPKVVFDRLADIQEGAGSPGSPVLEMEKIPPGPTGVGTRWREVVRLSKRWPEIAETENLPFVRLEPPSGDDRRTEMKRLGWLRILALLRVGWVRVGWCCAGGWVCP